MLFLSALVILLSTIPLGVIAQDKYVPKANEELYGTWTNEQNNGDIYHPQKVVVTSDGYTGYSRIFDSVPLFTWKSWIDSKWTDSEGNIWYRVFGKGVGVWEGHRSQELYKLSKSATVMERAFNGWQGDEFDPSKYPTKIDLSEAPYRILFRAE
jgi:hypothetical protein